MPGWHNSIFRVGLVDGRQFVLRVHVPEEPASLVEPALRIAGAYACRLNFVPSPIRTSANRLWAPVERRVATLWPYIQGVVREEVTDSDRVEAAKCLGAIHGVGQAALHDLEGVPSELFARMDWRSNRRWDFAYVRSYLLSGGAQPLKDIEPAFLASELDEATSRMPAELSAISAIGMPTLAIHGDFYPNNLLFDESGRISAVIDWDESRIDWRAWDVANALLEFCSGPAGLYLDIPKCQKFSRAYEAAGPPLTPIERTALPLLIRARKLDDLMYSLSEASKLHQDEWDYLRDSITAWRQVQNLDSRW